MRPVKTVLYVSALVAALFFTLAQAPTTAGPTAPPPPEVFVPARADLAEAVFAMVVANAKTAGLAEPVTLCQACVAAHLGLGEATMRSRCQRACALR